MAKSLVTFALSRVSTLLVLMFIADSVKCGLHDNPQHAGGYGGVPPPPNSGVQQYGSGPPNSGAPQYGGGPPPQNSVAPQYGNAPPPPNIVAPQNGGAPPNTNMQGPPQPKPDYAQQWIQSYRDNQQYNMISYVYWTIPNEPKVMTPTIKLVSSNPGFPGQAFDPRSQAARICNILNPAAQGSSEKFATERTKVSRLLTAMNSDQRKQIANLPFKDVPENKKKYTLDRYLEAKYVLNSEKFMRRMATEPEKLDAFYLNAALNKKDWKDVNEIAATRSNKQIQRLLSVYETEYGKKLRDVIVSATNTGAKKVSKMLSKLSSASKTANPYQDLLLRIFDGHRDEYNRYEPLDYKLTYNLLFSNYNGFVQYNEPNMNEVAADITKIIDSPKNSDIYSAIFGQRSLGHIRTLITTMRNNNGKSLEGLIESNFKGEDSYKNFLLTICKVAVNMPLYFAERFKKAMDQNEKGVISGLINTAKNGGLNDDDFIRYTASRSQVDMGDIILAFLAEFKVGLLDKACQEDEINTREEYKQGVITAFIGNDPITGYTEHYDKSKLPESCR